MNVPPNLLPIIEEMLWEFMGSKPDTVKVPSRTHEGSWNRVTTTFNPEWYQDMCKDFPRPIQPSNPRAKRSKPRTIVKRKDTVKHFEWLLKNKRSSSKYAPYIVGEAQRRLETYEGDLIPWENQF